MTRFFGAWLGSLLVASSAFATVPDTFGTGIRHMGRGGGGVAHVGDGAAAMMNPSGLWRVRRPEVSLGFSAGLPELQAPPPVWWDTNQDGVVDERDPPLQLDGQVEPMWGLHASLARHIGSRVGFGVSIYMPTNRLFRLKTFDPTLPTYIQYDNRPHRYVLAAGLGGRVLPGFAIGAGVDIVPRVTFNVDLTADIEVQGASKDDDQLEDLVGDIRIDTHEIELDISPGVVPVVGLQLDFGAWSKHLEGLSLGAMWRGQTGMEILADLNLQANLALTDAGSLDPYTAAVVIDAPLAIFDHFLPMRTDIGISYAYKDALLLYGDARWMGWRQMMLSVSQLGDTTITAPLVDLNGNVQDGNSYALQARDTWEVRVGGEAHLPRFDFPGRLKYIDITLRSGVGYHPTPLVAQNADTALLDANRWSISGGAGISFWDPFKLVDGPIHFDMMFQLHQFIPAVWPHATDVPRAGFTTNGADIDVKGRIAVLGAEVGFSY